MLSKFDNCIFDLDGTIVNSSPEVLKCFKEAFIKAGCEVVESRFTSDVIGPPLKEIIENLAFNINDENKIAEIISNFRQIYDYDTNDISTVFDGMYELLTELKKSGKKLFIATFKPTIPTMRLLEHLKLDMFDDIYTIDKFGQPISKAEMIEDIVSKYKLSKDKTVMIGDASGDVIAASEAGITGIGVLWGYGTDKSYLIKNSDYVVSNAGELLCQKLNCPTT